jgi:iron complex transport system permease protein
MMIGSATSGMTNILSYFGTNDQLKSLNIWNFGSLSGVSWAIFPYFFGAILVGLGLAFYLTKSYNLLLLGESYAQSMGVNLKKVRLLSMLSTSLLAGTVTAFCGPIGFVGLMTPHIARMLYQTSNHRVLVPLGAFWGSIVLLLCDIIAQLPGSEMALPINAVTALIGAPFVIWLVLSNKKL